MHDARASNHAHIDNLSNIEVDGKRDQERFDELPPLLKWFIAQAPFKMVVKPIYDFWQLGVMSERDLVLGLMQVIDDKFPDYKPPEVCSGKRKRPRGEPRCRAGRFGRIKRSGC